MKNIFIVDWSLMPTGLATTITGIKVHVASEGTNHELWHQWSLWHVVCSLLFIEGPATTVGKVHYIFGLILVILCIGHTVKRFRILKKSLQPKN